MIKKATINELVEARRQARDTAEAFSDAIKAVAEEYRIAPSALRKYICALEKDEMEKLSKEAESLELLME